MCSVSTNPSPLCLGSTAVPGLDLVPFLHDGGGRTGIIGEVFGSSGRPDERPVAVVVCGKYVGCS